MSDNFVISWLATVEKHPSVMMLKMIVEIRPAAVPAEMSPYPMVVMVMNATHTESKSARCSNVWNANTYNRNASNIISETSKEVPLLQGSSRRNFLRMFWGEIIIHGYLAAGRRSSPNRINNWNLGGFHCITQYGSYP